VFFWNGVDLMRKLAAFRDYYNAHRVHRSLHGTTPARRGGAPSSAPDTLHYYGWQQHCRGLFQTPIHRLITNSPPTAPARSHDRETDGRLRTRPRRRAGRFSLGCADDGRLPRIFGESTFAKNGHRRQMRTC
jgi:hypothetical protein